MKPESVTVKNLEAAFAGESMAHIKYRYFAKIARAAGDVETAKVFEETAAQEVQHAFGHLDLLYPPRDMTPARALDMAIAGENQEGGTVVIPGHGRLSDETEVANYRDMVTIVRDRVAAMIDDGMTLQQVQAARPTSDYDGIYNEPNGWTAAMFVAAVYRDLAGATR